MVDGIPHRVVLIHEEQDVTINGVTIRSHQPFLRDAGRIISTPRRVSMRIANAPGGTPTYDDNYRCAIPKLQRLTAARLLPNRPVIIDGKRPAGAYFDIEHGDFSAAMAPGNAAAATLTVRTDGTPKLIVTPFDGGTASEIELTSGSTIQLYNAAAGPLDHQNGDFLLHYEVFETVPPDVRYPTTPAECPGIERLPTPEFELGPGCSNSTYP